MAFHHEHHHNHNASFEYSSTSSSSQNQANDTPQHSPGFMYSEPWVQDLLFQPTTFAQTNKDWLEVTDSKRVLDYACGNGVLSKALAEVAPNTTFQGVDISTAQVDRYNQVAIAYSLEERMLGVQGDLSSKADDMPQELSSPTWFKFDVTLISMALHHVSLPTEMLKRLAERVKDGG